jgi:hypothetical protein
MVEQSPPSEPVERLLLRTVPTTQVSDDSRTDHASRIRSRLLHRLGFEPTPYPTALPSLSKGPFATTTSRRIAESFHENLKADYGLPDLSTCSDETADGSTSSSSSYGSTKSEANSGMCRKKSVSFDAAVTVHPVPTRFDFSDRIRGFMWTPASEMQENAARNYLEFMAEGWDWHSVVDDKDMIVIDGERIHPVHLRAAQHDSVRRQFVSVLSAQQQHGR